MKRISRAIDDYYRWYDSHGHGFRLAWVLVIVALLSITNIGWQMGIIHGKFTAFMWGITLLLLFTRMKYVHGWFR